jgi:general stress protein YciG
MTSDEFKLIRRRKYKRSYFDRLVFKLSDKRRNPMTDKKEGMSVNEAGRKGGEATAASHDKEFYQEIGSKGGQNSGGNFANDPQRASEAGRKGGQNSGGNFANDREKASEAGQRGGQSSGGNSGGNFANDREKASEAGRKGGEHSHGGGRNS